MQESPRVKKGLFAVVLLLAVFSLFTYPARIEAASTGSLGGYTWSSSAGWIHMKGATYGVTTDSVGALAGYGWSSNVGWISFNAGDLAGCPSGACTAKVDQTTGAVSGWARAIAGKTTLARNGGWDGWIHLSGSGYGLTAGAPDGSGNCTWDGYAWGGGPDLNSDTIGWVHAKGASYGITGTGTACVSSQPADLVPGTLMPTGTTQGDPTTFIGGINNIGGTDTAQFGSNIYVCPHADGPCESSALTMHTPTLLGRITAFIYPVVHAASWFKIPLSRVSVVAHNSGQATGTHTFDTAGSFDLNFCADIPLNEVPESDDSPASNCNDWGLTFTVCPTGQTWNGAACIASQLSCTPTTASFTSGSGGTLRYNATPSTLGNGAYTWAPQGTLSTYLSGIRGTNAQTGLLTLNTSAPDGSYDMKISASGYTSGTCRITVGSVCGVPVTNITAVPARVVVGNTSHVSWTASSVNTSCVVTGPGVNKTDTAASCNISADSADPTISTQSTYCIVCDANQATKKCVTVDVAPKIIQF